MISMTQLRALSLMAELDEEMVYDAGIAWVDLERFSLRTLLALLRLTAVSDVSDTKGIQRYVINSVGLALLDNPHLSCAIGEALAAQTPFTITDGEIHLLNQREAV